MPASSGRPASRRRWARASSSRAAAVRGLHQAGAVLAAGRGAKQPGWRRCHARGGSDAVQYLAHDCPLGASASPRPLSTSSRSALIARSASAPSASMRIMCPCEIPSANTASKLRAEAVCSGLRVRFATCTSAENWRAVSTKARPVARASPMGCGLRAQYVTRSQTSYRPRPAGSTATDRRKTAGRWQGMTDPIAGRRGQCFRSTPLKPNLPSGRQPTARRNVRWHRRPEGARLEAVPRVDAVPWVTACEVRVEMAANVREIPMNGSGGGRRRLAKAGNPPL